MVSYASEREESEDQGMGNQCKRVIPLATADPAKRTGLYFPWRKRLNDARWNSSRMRVMWEGRRMDSRGFHRRLCSTKGP
jgi:hypothetical protein